jgi:hypothetical protein
MQPYSGVGFLKQPLQSSSCLQFSSRVASCKCGCSQFSETYFRKPYLPWYRYNVLVLLNIPVGVDVDSIIVTEKKQHFVRYAVDFIDRWVSPFALSEDQILHTRHGKKVSSFGPGYIARIFGCILGRSSTSDGAINESLVSGESSSDEHIESLRPERKERLSPYEFISGRGDDLFILRSGPEEEHSGNWEPMSDMAFRENELVAHRSNLG